MNGRILVTGGAGFVGSHLVDALVASGEHVTVLDDFSTGNLNNLRAAQAKGDVRVVHGSILDARVLDTAMADIDRVFHLAVQCVRRSLREPRESHDVNATGTLFVLEAARRRHIRRFVYCSSCEVYGNTLSGLLHEDTTPCRPVTVYGGAKLAGESYTEAYFQTYGMPTVVVRPFNAYGPRAHDRGELAEVIPRFVIRALSGQSPVIFGDGSNGRDFTYVTDVAHGLALAGANEQCIGQRINIAYGRMVTIQEVAETVLKVCGRNDLSADLYRPRPGDVHVLAADTRRASEWLGYRAEIPFEAGVGRYVDWFRQTYPNPKELVEDQIENWAMPETGVITP
jgi:UDP-glucose 4-epimerase